MTVSIWLHRESRSGSAPLLVPAREIVPLEEARESPGPLQARESGLELRGRGAGWPATNQVLVRPGLACVGSTRCKGAPIVASGVWGGPRPTGGGGKKTKG